MPLSLSRLVPVIPLLFRLPLLWRGERRRLAMKGGASLKESKDMAEVAVALQTLIAAFSDGLSLHTLVSSEAVSASLLIRLPVDAMPNNLLLLLVVVMPFCVGFSVES